MMKLEVEIKDDKFIYHYKIGENEHTSESKLSAEFLCAFTSLLSKCAAISSYECDRRLEEIKKEAYIKDALQGKD